MKKITYLIIIVFIFLIAIASLSSCSRNSYDIQNIVEPISEDIREKIEASEDEPVVIIRSFPIFRFYHNVDSIEDILQKVSKYEEDTSHAGTVMYFFEQRYPAFATLKPSQSISLSYRESGAEDFLTGSYHFYEHSELVYTLSYFFENPEFPFACSRYDKIPQKVDIERVTFSDSYGSWILYETNQGDFVFFGIGDVQKENEYKAYLFPLDDFLKLAPFIEEEWAKDTFEGKEVLLGYYNVLSDLPVSPWELNIE